MSMTLPTFHQEVMDRVVSWPGGRERYGHDADDLVMAYLWAADIVAEMARKRWPDLAPRPPYLEAVARLALASAADDYHGGGPFLPFAGPYLTRAIIRAIGYPEPLPARPASIGHANGLAIGNGSQPGNGCQPGNGTGNGHPGTLVNGVNGQGNSHANTNGNGHAIGNGHANADAPIVAKPLSLVSPMMATEERVVVLPDIEAEVDIAVELPAAPEPGVAPGPRRGRLRRVTRAVRPVARVRALGSRSGAALRALATRPALLAAVAVGLSFVVVAMLIAGAYWKVGELQTERARGSISITDGEMTSSLLLTSGAGRPQLWSYDLPLVEYSAWDSTLVVDGVPHSLWEHYFNYSVSQSDRSMVVTIEGDEQSYLLEQVVSVEGDQAVLEWYFVPLAPVRFVELKLGHFQWYWVGAFEERDSVILLASEMDRRSLEQGVRPSQAREVIIHLGDGAEVSAGYASPGLVNFFDSTYQTVNPKVGARNLIAREVVELGSFVPLDSATGSIQTDPGDTGIERKPLPRGYRRGGIDGPNEFYDDGSGGFHG